mmetsp:Transcript_4390/g.9645  ORF Transcript_4390/g.9645 Transcript_4390/m.9645 type:complete len:981 (-) Transcript_4390:105-3047(-)
MSPSQHQHCQSGWGLLFCASFSLLRPVALASYPSTSTTTAPAVAEQELVTPSISPRDSQQFRVALFLRPDEDRLRKASKLAQQISDPEAEEYGNYLSQKEVADRVGIDVSEALAASAWFEGLLDRLEATNLTVGVVPHRDAVLAEVSDFSATYQLGVVLAGRGDIHLASNPDRAELFVSPAPPEGYCDVDTESECFARPPCNYTRHNATSGRCSTDFAGWICWPSARNDFDDLRTLWTCDTPNVLQGLSDYGRPEAVRRKRRSRPVDRKRRRRGRSLNQALLEVEPHYLENPLMAEFPVHFRVSPRSDGLLLSFPNHTNRPKEWQSVEISFRQRGTYHSHVFKQEDFQPWMKGEAKAMSITGVHNLEAVDDIAVCLGGEVVLDTYSYETGRPGCACDKAVGLDLRLGRRCMRLSGSTPSREPMDFVLPRIDETLTMLRQDLGLDDTVGRGGRASTVAVAEFMDQSFLQDDVDSLLEGYGLRATSDVEVVGPPSAKEVSVGNSGEGSLDLQVVAALAPAAPLTWWSIGVNDMDSFVLAHAVQVNIADRPPHVHSISWGDAEAVYPPQFVQRLDYEYMKMVLRGITVLLATGDNGISASVAQCDFISDLAGSSPWVTGVGATTPSKTSKPYCSSERERWDLGACQEVGPVTCSVADGAIITSSGYFSIYRNRPDYQSRVVGDYLSDSSCSPCQTNGKRHHHHHEKVANETDLTAPCQHLANEKTCPLRDVVLTGRGSPDIALPGSSYPIHVNGSLAIFDGTSASAPALAALIGLLNEEQARRREPPLGFLNTWLYWVYERHPEAFRDVLVGDIGSNEESLCPWGFKAGPGWDATTGLGVPQFNVLKEHLPRRGPGGIVYVNLGSLNPSSRHSPWTLSRLFSGVLFCMTFAPLAALLLVALPRMAAAISATSPLPSSSSFQSPFVARWPAFPRVSGSYPIREVGRSGSWQASVASILTGGTRVRMQPDIPDAASYRAFTNHHV